MPAMTIQALNKATKDTVKKKTVLESDDKVKIYIEDKLIKKD